MGKGMIGPRKVDKRLILYGYGNLGHLAEEIFNELHIPIAGILGRHGNFRGRCQPAGHDALLAVCIASESYRKVTASLKTAGWTDMVPVWDIIEAYPQIGLHNGWIAGELSKEDRDGISRVSLGFADKLSLTHYYAFVDWRRYHDEVAYDAEKLEPLPSTLADIRYRQCPTQQYLVEPGEAVAVHCEGYELETLRNNISDIRKYLPSISCACYHSRDGLWEIEKYLMDSLPDYQWKFRMSAYMGQSAYIMGCPKERLL
jgi:hypothetical protein